MRVVPDLSINFYYIFVYFGLLLSIGLPNYEVIAFYELLWGSKAKFSHLFFAATILLLMMLGSREIWTQEHRWADIVAGMFFRNDFLHPYLGQATYYDKPLLSYWLIVIASKITGSLSTWSLRLPSALSGLLAVWSIYRLGTTLKNKQMGLLAGWLLITTFYFIFGREQAVRTC